MDMSDASKMEEPLVDVLRNCRMPGSPLCYQGPQIPLRYLVPMKSPGRYLDNEDTAEQSNPRPTPRLEKGHPLTDAVSITYLLAGRGQVGLQTGQGQCQLSAVIDTPRTYLKLRYHAQFR
ncbi:hypothetical protein ASPBRDRAFT_56504 [Aspergillus brasiliensis CBS 101740]|uniref:Uncharacterized protein n=1 Tax=Aspergillus brasiliensis (strain CBS 101740 / IMI 381727 / IBT 21946) TaxID=767769 RepID=A0A1L9UGI1_ASPBC|nr:hypothetical protein ASPBRDRAFT_56504 [Aspergillus brasiliensis CBS 101740]